MSLTKLHLFTKDTDATATEQGFYFQKLVTLRTWLKNSIEQNSVAIYCDYEEDVFERSLREGKATFTQVKLYSDNFSFSQDEIVKCIVHFFMLYCKGDYVLDDVTFIFETNSGFKRQYKTGDPKLLQEWWENQDELSEDLLMRCRIKVKSIIDNYLAEVLAGKISSEIEEDLQEAKEIYDKLSDEVWDRFVKSIRWKFDRVSQEEAIPQLQQNLEELVTQLPLMLDPNKSSTYLAVLLSEITVRTAEKEPEDKLLTQELLDILLLNMGSEKDRWYAGLYAKWREIGKVTVFNVGQFYEIIAATRHCRWELFATDHDDLWLDLLRQFIELEDIIIPCRRKAIYEFIFLLLSPDPQTFTIKTGLEGTEHIIRYYFDNREERISFGDIEDDITFLEVVASFSHHNPGFLNTKELSLWREDIATEIEQKIAAPRNPDDLCLAYQLMGHFHFHNDPAIPFAKKIYRAVEYYRKIVAELPNVKTYSTATLSSQTTALLDLLIKTEVEIEAREMLEEFLVSIEDYAYKTGNGCETARNLVQRSASYLSKSSVKNNLAALTSLHKAKNYCNNDDCRHELIFVLINLSKVYASLGMNMAAKYYGLVAMWGCHNFGNYSIFKLLSDSYAAVFHADFTQGAWFSALDDFHNYMFARTEFNADALDLETDRVLAEVLVELSIILTTGTKIHPELQAFLQYQKQNLGWVYTRFIEEIDQSEEAKFGDAVRLKKMLERSLTMVPFSDAGPQRNIYFKTLGIEWNIRFTNSIAMNAVAEEFAALLQIILCEISLMGVDLHLVEMPITINLTKTDQYHLSLSQQMSNDEAIWDLAIPVLAETVQKNVQMHYAYLSTSIRVLLSNISLLPDEEFYTTFDTLYTKQKLGEKGLILNTYQKVYLSFVNEQQFDNSQRSAFNPVDFPDFNAAVPGLYTPTGGLSPRYSQDSTLDKIEGRYQNARKRLSVSLNIWKQDNDFKIFIDGLREAGWLDWQILLALSNFVISSKVNIVLERNPPTSKEEAQLRTKELYQQMLTQTEDQNYIPIPLEWLYSEEFSFHLNKLPVDVLDSYGLQNGMKYPNFKAVRKYLSERFKFEKVDKPEVSPLHDY